MSDTSLPPSLSAILNHLGEDRSQYRRAVTPPIYQTSNFAFESVAVMRAAGKNEFGEAFYTRGNNPSVEILRRKLAALEGTEDALVLSSGAAAMAAAILGSVRSGEHVICVQKPYSWTRVLVRDWLPRLGIAFDFVDGSSTAAIAAAIRPQTRLLVLESPNSLTFETQDLAAVAAMAREHGIRTLCDNSYCSPLLQRPAELGIDLVAHSATKYLNGHSDVVAGVLCGSQALIKELFRGPYMTFGAIPAPFEAWLMLRGLRTLDLRLRRSCDSARQVLAFLRAHPRVRRVWYPPEPLGSGLLSFELDAHEGAEIEHFCDRLNCFLLAVSWGGHESLVWPLVAVLPDGNAQANRTGLPLGLIRLSIGLEDPAELIADLEQALAL